MKRQTVVDMVLNAYTLNDCLSAEETLIHWVNDHPDDLGMHELAGQLGIVKAAAQEQQSGSLPTFPEPSLVSMGR